jgi:high-affinity K+ transport system ATPase subunit B
MDDPEYEWPGSESVRAELKTLHAQIRESDEQSVLLALERVTPDETDATSESTTEATADVSALITGATGQKVDVVEPFARAADALESTVEPGDTFVDKAIRNALQDDSEEQRRIVEYSKLSQSAASVTVSPALTSLVRAHLNGVDESRMAVFVNYALAVAIAEYSVSNSPMSKEGVETILSQLSDPQARQPICSDIAGGV